MVSKYRDILEPHNDKKHPQRSQSARSTGIQNLQENHQAHLCASEWSKLLKRIYESWLFPFSFLISGFMYCIVFDYKKQTAANHLKNCGSTAVLFLKFVYFYLTCRLFWCVFFLIVIVTCHVNKSSNHTHSHWWTHQEEPEVQYLAQAGIESPTFWFVDDVLYLLSRVYATNKEKNSSIMIPLSPPSVFDTLSIIRQVPCNSVNFKKRDISAVQLISQ